jgi:hypothetical protein
MRKLMTTGLALNLAGSLAMHSGRVLDIVKTDSHRRDLPRIKQDVGQTTLTRPSQKMPEIGPKWTGDGPETREPSPMR